MLDILNRHSPLFSLHLFHLQHHKTQVAYQISVKEHLLPVDRSQFYQQFPEYL